MDDKTILYRLPTNSTFVPYKGNSYISTLITLNEPDADVVDEPPIRLIRQYARRVREIIDSMERQ